MPQEVKGWTRDEMAARAAKMRSVEIPKSETGEACASKTSSMPIGSPGMEHGHHRERFQVIAWGPAGRRVVATHN